VLLAVAVMGGLELSETWCQTAFRRAWHKGQVQPGTGCKFGDVAAVTVAELLPVETASSAGIPEAVPALAGFAAVAFAVLLVAGARPKFRSPMD
jgi:hypothetical protein